MSLDYAILGFLNYKPFSGYDLKKIFDVSVRHFWYADQSQIYRTLNRLNEQGMVEKNTVEQEKRPNRKIYSITEEGQTALREWLLSKPELGESHSSPLIQVFFAGQFPDEVVIQLFTFMSSVMDELLARYDEVPEQIDEYRDLVKSDRERYFWMSTLDLGMRVAKAQQEWAKDMIADLENHNVPQD